MQSGFIEESDPSCLDADLVRIEVPAHKVKKLGDEYAFKS